MKMCAHGNMGATIQTNILFNSKHFVTLTTMDPAVRNRGTMTLPLTTRNLHLNYIRRLK